MKRNKRIALMVSGIVLMGAAFGLTAYNLYEDSSAADYASQVQQQLSEQLNEIVSATQTVPQLPTGITGELIQEEEIDPNTPMPTIEIDGSNYIGTVVIPALGLELPVAEDWDYVQMKKSPCRYYGSLYKNNFVICGHNYSSHFGTLVNLRTDDEVIFIDAAGNEFYYKVEFIDTLTPFEVGKMVSSDSDLTLFTCNYALTDRVTVRCRLTDKNI